MTLGKQAGHDLHQQHCLFKVAIYAVASQTDDLHPTYTSWQKFLCFLLLFIFLMWVLCIAAVAAQTDALCSTDLPADNKQHCCMQI